MRRQALDTDMGDGTQLYGVTVQVKYQTKPGTDPGDRGLQRMGYEGWEKFRWNCWHCCTSHPMASVCPMYV